MLTQVETQKLMQERKTGRTYVAPNQYLMPGCVEDVFETCKSLYAEDVLAIAQTLKISLVPVFYRMGTSKTSFKWSKMTIEDIICLIGTMEYADTVGPIKFRGGPQISCRNDTQDKPYQICTGTLLTWIVDQILYYVSIRGPKVWTEIGMPL